MMDWYAKAFLRSSLAWLAAGVTLGVAMAVYSPFTMYRTAHMHMNLLGFVTMMIFGVAYHVIPRFTGNPLHDRRLAVGHWWIANIGLACFAAGLLALPHRLPGARSLVIAGGTLSAVSAYVFIYNIWRTLDGRRTATAEPGGPSSASKPEATIHRRRTSAAPA